MSRSILLPFARPGGFTQRELWVRELILFAGLLAAGFLVLPAMAWLSGIALLGAQMDGVGPGKVYGSVFGEAARGKPSAWLFAATPWLFLQSLRLMFWPFHRPQSPVESADRAPPDNGENGNTGRFRA